MTHGSIVLGFTSPLKSGKNPRISAAVRIGAPVTETRAPNASALFADSRMRLRVRPSNGFQSTVYAVPSSCLTTMIECGFLYSTLSTRPSTVMRLWNARGGARQKSLVRQGYRLPAGLEAGSATRAVALLSRLGTGRLYTLRGIAKAA